jgi:hypothetical protein
MRNHILMSLAAGLLVCLIPAAAGTGVQARCYGEAVTITGTAADDQLTGTAGNDVIAAFGATTPSTRGEGAT